MKYVGKWTTGKYYTDLGNPDPERKRSHGLSSLRIMTLMSGTITEAMNLKVDREGGEELWRRGQQDTGARKGDLGKTGRSQQGIRNKGNVEERNKN